VKLLADTSALLALFLRGDHNHRAAAEFVHMHPEARFVMTELVLAEVVTLLRGRAGAERAVESPVICCGAGGTSSCSSIPRSSAALSRAWPGLQTNG
jgi:hypothetical protein